MGNELQTTEFSANKNSPTKGGKLFSPSRNENKLKKIDQLSTTKSSTFSSKDHFTTERSKHKQEKRSSKIVLIALNKQNNTEKKSLELVHKNNDSKKDYDMINSVIDKHFFMQTLNRQARDEIITTMSLCKLKEGKVLFKEGEIGCYWYIISEGTLEMFLGNEKTGELSSGDSFGDHALMNDVPRAHTVVAKTDCLLWVLKREAFRKILDYLFQVNYEQNMKFLNTVNLPIDNSFKTLLANSLVNEIYKKDTVIFKEGDAGNSMYIIKSGEVSCIKKGNVIRVLKQGDNLGQKAILTHGNRSLDVVAKTDCVLCSISIDFFKNQLGDNYVDVLFFSFIVLSFSKSKYFSSINEKMLIKTLGTYTIKNYGFEEVIFKKGENINNKLCVILEGSIYNKTLNKTEAKRYEFLFESEMYENKPIKLTQDLVANPDCMVAIFDYEAFKAKLGGTMKKIEKKSEEMASLDEILMFKNLSDEKKELIQSKLKVEEYANGKKIITQGEIGDKLFIIKSGRVDFFINSKYIRSFGENEEFGARALIIKERRSATAIANGKVQVYSLSSTVFKSILEPSLIKYFENKFYLEDNSIELKDLDNIKDLGKGNYGFVTLVRCKKNKQLYAIKALSLKQIKHESLEECVDLEKNVLLKVDHPFIMKMVKYFKNENYIFFLFEYIKGKELWEIIREIGLLNKEQTQFYGASMLLAIEYLHKKKIIYRDIKPENIMVNDIGYIKIIDFGTVKEIKDRTSTVIGTPHYMAPEIIKGEGYSFEVDVWSIAICMYEFFCGKLPFGEEFEETMDIYKAINKGELKFPSFVKDNEFKKIIQKMLQRNPLDRLCKFSQIKNDPYFQSFDWDKLISLCLPAPYLTKLDDDISKNIVPYLTYIKSVSKGEMFVSNNNKRNSLRAKNFGKWFKNF